MAKGRIKGKTHAEASYIIVVSPDGLVFSRFCDASYDYDATTATLTLSDTCGSTTIYKNVWAVVTELDATMLLVYTSRIGDDVTNEQHTAFGFAMQLAKRKEE